MNPTSNATTIPSRMKIVFFICPHNTIKKTPRHMSGRARPRRPLNDSVVPSGTAEDSGAGTRVRWHPLDERASCSSP